jgi:hypothetical protein
MESSQADAILVVRVVPIDSFFIDVGAGTHFETTPELGRQRVEDSRPIAHTGRLLAGQVFLLDRRTSLRLWSKQLPDYPEGGRLTPQHPFLAYGYVHDPNQGASPPADARAPLAAHNFVEKMLSDFPKAQAGSDGGRQDLAGVDLDRETAEQTFFDNGHLAFDIGPSWAFERASLNAQLDTQAIPAIGTGGVAPSGLGRVTPRLGYTAPGGWTFALAVPLGYAPSSFSRSYERDNATKNAMDPTDRIASVSISGTRTYGIEGTVGLMHAMLPRLYLLPSLGAFIDFWDTSASPDTVFAGAGTTRVGGLGSIDLLLQTSEGSSLFVRGGASVRIGQELGGPLIYGLQLGASIGFFF